MEHQRNFRLLNKPVVLKDPVPPPTAPTPSVAVNGYHGALPGGGPVKTAEAGPNGTVTGSLAYDPTSTCSRSRPYVAHEFRKRHVLRVENLHITQSHASKATQPASLRCWCVKPAHCLLCTGRADSMQPIGWPALGPATVQDRIAALDPSFHPVLSFPHDVPLAVHLDSVMRLHEWQARANRCSYKYKYNKYNRYNRYNKDHKASLVRLKKDKHVVEQKRKIHKHATALLSAKLLKKKLTAGKKRRELKPLEHEPIPPLRIRKAKKISSLSGADSGEDELYVSATPVESGRASPETTTSGGNWTASVDRDDVRRRGRACDSFDINNIVIPYSIAAATRVEMLQYKEIPTPKWRRVDEPCEDGGSRSDDADEDISDQAVVERHARCEEAERRKFMSYIKLPLAARGRAARRTDSRAESSGANTPDPMSPMPIEHCESPMTTPPATPQAAQVSDDFCATTSASTPGGVRRRTISNSRGILLRDKLERAAAAAVEHERCLTPDPEDEVPPYEDRTYPLRMEDYQRMLAQMPPEVPPSPAFTYQQKPGREAASPPLAAASKAVNASDGERAAYHCDGLPESPSSSSTISAMEEGEEPDDPNDPEWRALEEDEEEYRNYRGRR